MGLRSRARWHAHWLRGRAQPCRRAGLHGVARRLRDLAGRRVRWGGLLVWRALGRDVGGSIHGGLRWRVEWRFRHAAPRRRAALPHHRRAARVLRGCVRSKLPAAAASASATTIAATPPASRSVGAAAVAAAPQPAATAVATTTRAATTVGAAAARAATLFATAARALRATHRGQDRPSHRLCGSGLRCVVLYDGRDASRPGGGLRHVRPLLSHRQ